MMQTPHLGFIVAAYAIAAAVILAMIVSVLLDYRVLSASLGALEAERRDKGTP